MTPALAWSRNHLRILYATERAHIPDRVDGALYAAHSLLKVLGAAGHTCEAVASIEETQRLRTLAYRGMRAVSGKRLLSMRDRRNGYATYRCSPWLVGRVVAQRVRALRPDVILTQLEGSEAIARLGVELGVPVLVWIHDNEFTFFTGQVPASPLVQTISSSDFVSETVRERLGYESKIVYPPILLDRCLARREHPDSITFINPVPQKGVSVALQVARLLPHRKFLFVETWPLSAAAVQELQTALYSLPNVTFRRWSKDIRAVYDQTQLLLMPSQWVEAYGAVVIEAHANGIPVVASRIGGIPATVADGGELLDPRAPAEHWAKAIESILSTPAAYERYAARARANAARDAIKPERIGERFIEIARDHASRARTGARAGRAGTLSDSLASRRIHAR